MKKVRSPERAGKTGSCHFKPPDIPEIEGYITMTGNRIGRKCDRIGKNYRQEDKQRNDSQLKTEFYEQVLDELSTILDYQKQPFFINSTHGSLTLLLHELSI
jgi:hypothetical protein